MAVGFLLEMRCATQHAKDCLVAEGVLGQWCSQICSFSSWTDRRPNLPHPHGIPFQTDLVSAEDLADINAQVRAINAVAEVRCTRRSAVDLAWVLDTRCFSPELALAVDPSLAPAGESSVSDAQNRGAAPGGTRPALDMTTLPDTESGGYVGREKDTHGHGPSAHGHDHNHDHGEDCAEFAEVSREGPGGTACSVHDPAVTTCAVDLAGSLELTLLERWLGGLLWEPPPEGTEVYRVKGVVSVEGRDERFVVQGVADLFEVAPAGVSGSAWREGEARRCKIVFIGRYLSRDELERGVRSCMV